MSDPKAASAPAVEAETGWEPVEPPRLEGGRGSFVSGDPAGDRLRVRYFRRISDGRLVGRAWFGPGALGPPGHAHGGSIAAVLDEAMGAAAWMAGRHVVAVKLETNFQRLLPLGTDTWIEAWIDRVEGRKVWTLGEILDAEGEPFARGQALFVTLDPERNAKILEAVTAALGERGAGSPE